MQIDAHYYAVLAFSRAAGFKKQHARDIAYASQFVDDAKINHVIPKGKVPPTIKGHLVTIGNEKCFYDMATCHSYKKIETFNYNSMSKNTIPFHFMPGCDGNNFVKKLRCKENGPVIQAMFDQVIERGNLLELGIALHVFADTYSHQGFSGLLSKVNDITKLDIEGKSRRIGDIAQKLRHQVMKNIYAKFDKYMPAYGHGQALEFPDIPYLSWSYHYDSSDEFSSQNKYSGPIHNKMRFKAAFEEIETYLGQFAKEYYKQAKWSPPVLTPENRQKLFDTLTVKKPTWGRKRAWRKTMVDVGLFQKGDPTLTYSDKEWLKEAFVNYNKKKFNQRMVPGAVLAGGFVNSKWFAYYQAVHWFKGQFFDCCSAQKLNIPK